METPLVSVVIPVHNAMPYLRKGIDSILRQSIGTARMEVLAVDDGSTDGSGEVLDEAAERHPALFRVLHQEPSGTPSAPRNRALDLARGKYVFLLDADDYLGDEALERMVAMAEENDSDVVLGKLVGVNGRLVAMSMFQRDQPKADLYRSRVYWSLGPLKLYRRDLIERHRLRFPTDIRFGEDRPFVARALYYARAISVVAEYDCVYTVNRDDGGNLTSGGMAVPAGRGFRRESALEVMAALMCDTVPPGPKQDFLMHRHWECEGDLEFTDLAALPVEEQRVRLAALRRLLADRYRPGAARRLRPDLRLAYHLVQAGDLDGVLAARRHKHEISRVGRGGRVWATLPGREDEAGVGEGPWVDMTDGVTLAHWLDEVGTAGEDLLIRGTGRLRRVPHERLVLHLEFTCRETGAVKRVPVDHRDGIFTVRIRLPEVLGPLRKAVGHWEVGICAALGGTEFRTPFGTRLGGPLLGGPVPSPVWRDRYGRAMASFGPVKRNGPLALRVHDRGPRATAATVLRRVRHRRASAART
ncbi:glycosyltransferase family 2 protein [Glycomyces tritici]|uniref:Glycosyltransferase n=1 Tax=Glycomyces tritici TaxID=2665176 RepID=A0ABT7YP84_9ACTN|nr:glycosyltransferase [Glycomyces tritici]MDN3240422.1 glycosyltransferase [Glycomyces tritici]